MAKKEYAPIDKFGVVVGIYDFKDYNEAAAHFPGLMIVDVSNEDPMPGPGWSYDSQDESFSPPVVPSAPFNPVEAAKRLIETIDFTKLDNDEGKALTAILYLVGGLDEEVEF